MDKREEKEYCRGLINAMPMQDVRKIQVVHLIEDLSIGGIQRIVVSIVSNLDKEKYNACVWCVAREGELTEELRAKGIKVRALGLRYGFSLAFLFKLSLAMRHAKIDILHCHGYTATTLGRAAALFVKIPIIIVHMHTSLVCYSRKQRAIEKVLALFTDKIICCSEFVADTVRVCLGIRPAKLEVVYNGTEESRFSHPVNISEVRKEFHLSDDARVIGCVASLLPHKGHRYLLEAAKILIESSAHKIPAVKFLLVGDGFLRKELEEYAFSLGVNTATIFCGLRNDVPRLLSIMDMVVLPSIRWEGLGISLIEAMASGKPIIGTKVGGIAEIIRDGQTGMLVSPEDPQALVEVITVLLTDKEKAQRMGVASRKAYEQKFTTGIMIQKIDSLYTYFLHTKLRRGH